MRVASRRLCSPLTATCARRSTTCRPRRPALDLSARRAAHSFVRQHCVRLELGSYLTCAAGVPRVHAASTHVGGGGGAITDAHSAYSVAQANVFKVCDEPHPLLIGNVVAAAMRGDLPAAHFGLMGLCDAGHAPADVASTLFRVVRNSSDIEEYLKLEVLRAVGFAQMRVAEGVGSRLQLSGLLARVCQLAARAGGAR
jgi:Replication factor C C-terminal domain